MANLEEIVSRKTENDSQWKARQQADRENLMALQDAAVMELSLRVATRDMAQRMRANWEKESESLYATLLTALLKADK